MKRNCLIFIILIVSLPYSSTHAVTIPDVNLAATLRDAIGLNENESITEEKLQELESLDATKKDIKDLTGLEKATD